MDGQGALRLPGEFEPLHDPRPSLQELV